MRQICRLLNPRPILMALLLVSSLPLMAANGDVGRLLSSFGEVMVSSADDEGWRPVKASESLIPGMVIRTGRLSGASLVLQDESLIRLSQNTRFGIHSVRPSSFWRDATAVVSGLKEGVRTSFRLLSGKLWGRNNNTDVDAEISTLTATFGVRGTEFTIEASDDSSRLTVHEGIVLARGSSGEVSVKPGEQAVIARDESPQKSILKDSTRSLQWTVSVPNLLHLRPYLKKHVANKVTASGVYEAMKKKITPMLLIS